eukprot:304659-Prymnesium_polylepis.1
MCWRDAVAAAWPRPWQGGTAVAHGEEAQSQSGQATSNYDCGRRLGRSDWSGRHGTSAICVMQGTSPVLLAPARLRARMLSVLMQSSGRPPCRRSHTSTSPQRRLRWTRA